jgi:hypothetical protein
MHRATLITPVILLAAFLWANARVSRLAREFDVGPPESYGPVAASLFMRGWPISPWMICPIHGMKMHPEETFVWVAFIIDAAPAMIALLIVGTIVEWSARALGRRRNANH